MLYKMLTFGEKKSNLNLSKIMKNFQQKLKEVYKVFSLTEHLQDQKADEELKFLIKHYLLKVLSKDQFIEYNIPQIVDRIFEMVQHHINKTQNIQSNFNIETPSNKNK